MAATEDAEAVQADRTTVDEFTAELISAARFILLTRDDTQHPGELVALNAEHISAIVPTPYGCMVYMAKDGHTWQWPVRDDFDELVRTLNGEDGHRPPSIADGTVAPGLIEGLTHLCDEYGAAGVASALFEMVAWP